MDLHIKDVLKKMIREDKKVGNGYYTEKVRHFWKNELSESISKRTKDIRYTNGTLILKLESAALRQELFNNKESLISRLNEFLGEEVITDISIK